MSKHPLIIIGSGPAGLTAAIYASRAHLKPLMIEGYQRGGQLMLTSEVENFPGFPKGIMGPELMDLMKEQAIKFGTEILSQDVTAVDLKKNKEGYFTVHVEDKTFYAQSIIIATGAKAKLLGLPSEMTFMGKGVSTCATCDGAFFRNEDIFIVGGGDSAMEEAIFLTRFAKTVTVIHRKNSLRASKIMQQKALNHAKIKFEWNSVVEEVFGSKGMEGVMVKNVETQTSKKLLGTGLFIAIGHMPMTELFKNQLECDSEGYLITKGKSSQTSMAGVFACGDVQDRHYRQAITAAASGCQAAIDAEKYLEYEHA